MKKKSFLPTQVCLPTSSPDFVTNFQSCSYNVPDPPAKPLVTAQELIDSHVSGHFSSQAKRVSIQVHCLKLCPLEEFLFTIFLQEVPSEWDCNAASANFQMVPAYCVEKSPWGILCSLGRKRQCGTRAKTMGIWGTSFV